jgi:penicillin-binding protein 1C
MSAKRKWAISVTIGIFGALIWIYSITPQYAEVEAWALGSDKILTDRHGRVLQMLRTDFKRRRLPWFAADQFPPHLKEMVLLSEDQRFFFHPGVDPLALLRSGVSWAKGSGRQGGSTITMQVVDLTDPNLLKEGGRIRKGTWSGKFRQLFWALFFDLKWSKEEILNAYLNEIHLKGEFQGVPSAAAGFFQKQPYNLNKEESALLVAMISAPNQNRDRLKSKACTVLHLYEKSGDDCKRLDGALTSLFEQKPRVPEGPNEALQVARRLFQESLDVDRIQTTLDADLQIRVQEILNRHVSSLKNKNVTQSAALVLDNSTGEVLAYVGSVKNLKNPSQVDGVVGFRQAGSTLKPFLYASAIESRYITAASVLLDDDTALSWSGGVYRPTNYDRTFHGPISVREALAASLNVPAVKVVTMVGLHETYRLMQDLGFKNMREPDYYGVSMALGAFDVQLETLTNTYRMLARGGELSALHFTPRSKELAPPPSRVFSAETSYILSRILSDPDARGIGFGWGSSLETPFWTAAKTGTSKDYRDNWCIGYSDRYTVGVWTGNFDASPMLDVSGVSGAAPAWAEIMMVLHKATPSTAPPIPPGVVEMKVQLPWASAARPEVFLAGSEPKSEKIEIAQEKKIQFMFPVNGAKLTFNPHLAKEKQALFVRFKGQTKPEFELYLDDEKLGSARSPFKIDSLARGQHTLSIRAPGREAPEALVRFEVQ